MGAHEFDVFNGGSSQMIRFLERRKKMLEEVPQRIVDRMSKDGLRYIQSGTKSITSNYQMYTAMTNDNVIETLGIAYKRIRNTSEHATFAEFGTGIVGERQPYPNSLLAWDYDVNSHGDKGWVYPIGEGFSWTKGEPAHAIYFKASQRLRERIETISKQEMKRVVK